MEAKAEKMGSSRKRWGCCDVIGKAAKNSYISYHNRDNISIFSPSLHKVVLTWGGSGWGSRVREASFPERHPM